MTPPATTSLLPVEEFAGEEKLWSPDAQRRWLLTLVLVGLALRIVRYLLRFPLWEDEACLCANLIDRGYAELTHPLTYCQVAPVLFLWCQLTVVKLLGYSEYTLRLVPMLCGVGSLLLFRHVAGRLVRGTALVLAVGIFAVAYPMTRYAAEAKPYGCDLMVSLAMLALAVEWLREPGRRGWLWALAAFVAPAIGFSFPALFMAGGLSLVIGSVLWRGRPDGWRARPRHAAPWIVFNLMLVTSFAALVILSRGSVGEANQKTMEEVHWADTFPPLDLGLPLWLLKTHAGGMLGYPIGGPRWGSSASLLCFLGGIVVLAQRRRGLLLAVFLMPLALNFIAAAMHRYPYGGHVRMALYLGPAFCLLIGLGLAAALAWHARRQWLPRGPLVAVVAAIVVLAAATLLRDLTHPYKSGTTLRSREFAQWFWFSAASHYELACFETDLKQSLSPGKLQCGWSSLYYCNQRIYSPRHAGGKAVDFDRVSAERPLRCVLYRSPKEEHDSPAPDLQTLAHWLEEMKAKYEPAGNTKFPCPAYDKGDRTQIADDYLEIYDFRPRMR